MLRKDQTTPTAPATGDPIRITSVKARIVNAGLRNWIFVRVETSVDGLVGWGEATLEWKTRAVTGAIEDIEPLLIGQDPRDIEGIYRRILKQGFWRLGVIGMTAVSGIEMALWDIFGKSVGLPVWRLLGGKVRERVKVYTHLGLGQQDAVYGSFGEQEVVDRALAVIDKGYRALKVVFIPYVHMTANGKSLRQVDNSMRALREAVGDDIDIMVDFHGRCGSWGAALEFARALQPYRPMFIEEPLPPQDVKGLIKLSQHCPVPLATGERLIGREEFELLVTERAIQIAQPDICHTGGLLETKKIASMCEMAGIGMAPHNPLGPIAGAAALHFAVSTPNFTIQEEMSGAVPWYSEVVQGPIRLVDGYWSVPEAPGLGVDVDEAIAAAHPYKQEPFITQAAVIDDGTV
ncbi:MAG: galactonate dehydratase, partial [Phyllobacterium sp.]